MASARTEVPMDRTHSFWANDFNLSIKDRFSSRGIFWSASKASANLFRTSVKVIWMFMSLLASALRGGMKFLMNQVPIYADLWSATLAIPVQDPPAGYKGD